jgi:hypothetical protein
MQLFLKIISATFFAVFLLIFMVTIETPQTIEASASGFIKKELKKEVLREMADNKFKRTLQEGKKWAKELGFEFKNKAVEAQVEKLIEEVVLFKLSGKSKEDYVFQNLFSSQKVNKLVDDKYEEINQALRIDIRIFSGINLTIFLAIFFLIHSYWDRKGLLLPIFLIIISTLLSALIYIFGQDWIYVVLYSRYMGFGYLIYIAIILGFLIDVVYNQAQITGSILQTILEVVSRLPLILIGGGS